MLNERNESQCRRFDDSFHRGRSAVVVQVRRLTCRRQGGGRHRPIGVAHQRCPQASGPRTHPPCARCRRIFAMRSCRPIFLRSRSGRPASSRPSFMAWPSRRRRCSGLASSRCSTCRSSHTMWTRSYRSTSRSSSRARPRSSLTRLRRTASTQPPCASATTTMSTGVSKCSRSTRCTSKWCRPKAPPRVAARWRPAWRSLIRSSSRRVLSTTTRASSCASRSAKSSS